MRHLISQTQYLFTMKNFCYLLLLLGCSMLAQATTLNTSTNIINGNRFDVFCYHDIKDVVDGNLEQETTALSTNHLARHFSWLKANGYTPVSVDDILAAQKGKPLPEKAVLLTFDDGYASFYTHVFPLLKLFNYPAVAALEGSWLQGKPDDMVMYGSEPVKRSQFLTEAQIREMADSKLVEFASHSYDLHHAVQSNPYGSTRPAAITRIYDAKSASYESLADYKQRIRNDLEKNNRLIQSLTGRKPRIMVWPYGAYSQEVVQIARTAGLPINFTLEDSSTNSNHVNALTIINRELIDANPTEVVLNDVFLRQPPLNYERVVHVDLDYVYDDNAEQMAKNIDALIERIQILQPSTVYLQAFADPNGDGTADALYFPNKYLPMRADIFDRVARQLQVRDRVKVYAWMPVLAFDLNDKAKQQTLRVVRSDGKQNVAGEYRKLSPFAPEARAIIKDIYLDLSTHARFQGLLFHDDALLTDFEDDSSYARKTYATWGLPETVAQIRVDAQANKKWINLKTRFLTDFTLELAQVVSPYQMNLKTARNLYAPLVLNPASEEWFAQNYADFLKNYDYTGLMAMPYMEGAPQPLPWLQQLVDKVKATPNGLQKTVFELQTVDWKNKKPLSDQEITRQFKFLYANGVRHAGYYPDDFVSNHPAAEVIRSVISVREFPYLNTASSATASPAVATSTAPY